MNALKLIIFDLDDTIIRSNLDYSGMRNKLLELFDPPLSEEYSNVPISKILEKIQALMPDKLQEGYKRIEKLEENGPANAEIISGAEDIPYVLKKFHISSAVLTNNTRTSIDKYIEKFTFLKEFLIVTRDEAKMKPDPDGIQKIMDIFKRQDPGITKENVLYIGDSFIDAGTCYNAGIKFILFKSRQNVDSAVFPLIPLKVMTQWKQFESIIKELINY